MARKQESSNILKDNWYLVVALVVLLGGGAIAAFRSGQEDEPLPTGVVGKAQDGTEVVRLGPDAIDDEPATTGYQHLSPDERDQKYIEEYTEELNANPEADEAAGILMKLAVVYRRQQQYDDAVIALEDILEKYPDSPHARTAVIQLPEVYQEAGDRQMARQSYERMMQFFPPESQEYQWAQKRYGEI